MKKSSKFFQKNARSQRYLIQNRVKQNIEIHILRQDRFYNELLNGNDELSSYILAFQQG